MYRLSYVSAEFYVKSSEELVRWNLQQQVPQFLFVNRNADFWGEGIGHG